LENLKALWIPIAIKYCYLSVFCWDNDSITPKIEKCPHTAAAAIPKTMKQ
jgi:hypothetical protein